MRILPTRLHAVLDYGLGAALIAFPYVGHLDQRGGLEWGPVLLGGGLILYSLFTNYEYGIASLLPLKVHLALDLAGGILLIGLALVWGPPPIVWGSLLVLGLIEIGSSLVTRTVTSNGPGLASPAIRHTTPRSKLAMPSALGPSTADGRPDYPEPAAGAVLVEQLRGQIDSGRTADKVAVLDPAAAPLGSDDEAAELHDEIGLALARRRSERG
jgi:hypothetical protein